MKLPKDATAQLERLLGRFIRHIPNNAEYHNRLIEELEAKNEELERFFHQPNLCVIPH